MQRRMIFLNFKCLSLLSDENLDKIGYWNIPTNPWRKLMLLNYIASYEKHSSALWDTTQKIFFTFLHLNN
jgi:hypothetical protein